MAYTATNMVGRAIKDHVFSAGHNDRSFLTEENIGDMKFAPHISRKRMDDNIYIRFQEDIEGRDFKEYELNFYKKHFSKALKAQNDRHIKAGNRSREKDMESYYRAKQTCPEEQFLQIGDKDSHPSAEVFRECVEDYINRFNLQFGSYCKLLDCGIHYDEATPHAHIRRVWTYDSRDGLKVSQTQALKQMGFERPDPDKKEDRYNNSKMAFTANDRNLWVEVCKDHGLEIKASERDKNMPHVSKEKFIATQVEKKDRELSDLEAQAKKMEAEVSRLERKLWDMEGQVLSQEEIDRIPFELLRGEEVKIKKEDFDRLRKTYLKAEGYERTAESIKAKELLLQENAKKAKREIRLKQEALEEERRRLEVEKASAFGDTVQGKDILGKARAYERMEEDGVLPKGYEVRQEEKQLTPEVAKKEKSR